MQVTVDYDILGPFFFKIYTGLISRYKDSIYIISRYRTFYHDILIYIVYRTSLLVRLMIEVRVKTGQCDHANEDCANVIFNVTKDRIFYVPMM